MHFDLSLTPLDRNLISSLQDFLPKKIYDFHLHFYREEHYTERSRADSLPPCLDAATWKADLARYSVFNDRAVAALAFGLPAKDARHAQINQFIQEQRVALGDPWSRCLLLAAPHDNPAETANLLREGKYAGIKAYHLYANRPDTFNASISEYAPEWMWEILHETRGILMLHMVLPEAIADRRNQREIIRFCQAYPGVQLVMAHAARCFNHRHGLEGLSAVAHLPNVWIDTSAVCEAGSLATALRVLGPQRILYGSDYPISEFRGRCVTVGDSFFWHHPVQGEEQESAKMTLIGIESLLALREALEGFGATPEDREDIFWNNALRCLGLPDHDESIPASETAWRAAREVISCGTGLLSKRAESFLTPQWPTYFTKASGCRIWDTHGRMFRDFVGGVGAIFLGYADHDVNRAVSRRLAQGSYCSLLPREEVELAHLLLELHPGMGKVRYARGGGEAMLLAVRTARAATGKSGIAFCGYHGWHDWYLAANLNQPDNMRPVPGLNPLGVPGELAGTSAAFRYNDLESLRTALEALKGNLAAVVMEPLRSQNPTPEFLSAVHAAVRSTGALLVVDEVTSGMRYGFPGISASLGLEPDLLVYAKAISNGIPFGVVLGRREVMEAAEPSFISSSYWTDGLGPAAALAVLKKIQREGTQQRVWQKGEFFHAELTTIASRHPGLKLEVSGLPVAPMLAFAPGESASALKMRLIEEMLARGFMLGTIVYLMDAHQEEDMAGFLAALEESLQVVAKEQESGMLEELKPNSAVTIGRLA